MRVRSLFIILVNLDFDQLNGQSIEDGLALNQFTTSLATSTSNVKTSKRGRGKGSRGSYKRKSGSSTKPPRLSNNAYASNSQKQQYIAQNQISCSSSFLPQSATAPTKHKVCINPEILRRLGYSTTSSTSGKIEFVICLIL